MDKITTNRTSLRRHPKIVKIIAKTNMGNLGSMRTLNKLGLQKVGTTWVPEKVLGGDVELQQFELNLKAMR